MKGRWIAGLALSLAVGGGALRAQQYGWPPAPVSRDAWPQAPAPYYYVVPPAPAPSFGWRQAAYQPYGWPQPTLQPYAGWQAPVRPYGRPPATAPQYASPQGPGAIRQCAATQPVAQSLSPGGTLPAPAQPNLPPPGPTSLPPAVPAVEATPGQPSAAPPTAPAAVSPVLPPSHMGGAGDSGAPPVDAAPCAGEDEPPCLEAGWPGEPARFYAGAEYLLWWVKKGDTPPLVTTSPVTGGMVGALGGRDTTVLFGNSGLDTDTHSGGRFTAGYWLGACAETAVEGSFFFLGERSSRFAVASSSGFPVLARPFFNANAMKQDVQLTAFPGQARDGITVEAPSRLWGAEADLRRRLCCGCNYRVDLLGGFRYVELEEGLHVTEDLTSEAPFTSQTGTPFPAGSGVTVSDRFDTRNRFYGGQVGLDAELRRGRWSLGLRSQVALGDMHEAVTINGSQLLTGPGGAPQQVFQGGLLALSSNSGRHERDRFAVVPEADLTIGYQLTDHVRVAAGYSFLYLSDVARPGDQIDPVLDPRRIPNFVHLNPAEAPRPGFVNPARPLFEFRETDFWAQGVNFSLEFRF